MTTTRPTAPSGPSWRAARATSGLARLLAGRPFLPLWAVVHHRGRRTGRALTVPVAVVGGRERFVIALPWGAGTNWARNVLAAGGCVLRWKGADVAVTRPELLDTARARQHYGRVTWAVVTRALGAEAFLVLHRS